MSSKPGHPESDQAIYDHHINGLSHVPPQEEETTPQWVSRQYQTLDLADARLEKRCLQIASILAEQPQDSLNQAAENWAQAKGAYRFIENARVTAQDLQTPIGDAAAKACASHRTIIAVQDTTTLSFDSARQANGLGTINDSPQARGMFYHPVLALEENGLTIGLLDQQYWCRETQVKHKAKTRKKRSIKEKESAKWLKGAVGANLALKTNLPPKQRPKVIHVFDSEGDVHETFQLIETLEDSAVIRSAQNRRAVTGQGQSGLAHDLVRQAPLLGEITIDVPRKPGQKKRTANLQLRAVTVTLTPRKNKYPHRYPITLNLVEAWEPEPPGKTTPLHWLLWTTEKVDDFNDALRIMRIYTLRWKIEDFFLVLKQGCRIEKVQFQDAERLAKLLSLYAPIATRILKCRDWARLQPEAPCTHILTDQEWKALWLYIHKKTPAEDQTPPTLAQAVLWIGRIGGHLNRKSDGMPGVKTLWLGFRDLAILTHMFILAKA